MIYEATLPRTPADPEGKRSFAETIRFVAPRLAVEIRARGGDPSRMRIVGADQVHGDRLAFARGDGADEGSLGPLDAGFGRGAREFPATDALVATEPDVLLAIQTADCLPILFRDDDAGVVAAAHCGWRGLDLRLAEKTVAAMRDAGADPDRVRAWIGPCIRYENYEVGPELAGRFRDAFPEADPSPDGRRLDLVAVARAQLVRAGLRPERIGDAGICTFADREGSHSYRRDGERAGRSISAIVRFEAGSPPADSLSVGATDRDSCSCSCS